MRQGVFGAHEVGLLFGSVSLGPPFAKFLLIQKLNLGKICLKAVVKVALSLQRLASTRQVKISNHMMIVPSQLPPTKKLPSCMYAEQITV